MYIMVFITVPSEQEAVKIADVLVESKIVACVNIIPAVKSIFFWQGKKEVANECLLIAKTKSSCFDLLKDTVTKLHSYDLPEIVAMNISEASKEYLNWINDTVSDSNS